MTSSAAAYCFIFACIVCPSAAEEREKRQVFFVGTSCRESTQCGRGAFCNSIQRCECLSTFVNIGGACFEKIEPDRAGCTDDRQCSSVWPGAQCTSSICRCPGGQSPFTTRDGVICLAFGSCPTNGVNPQFRETTGLVRSCGTGGTACPPTYDCICASAACTTSFCCPSRAFACVQQADYGAGSSNQLRFYYNSASAQCVTFRYGGSGGNANNFLTQAQCESYCKTGCPRGQPLYQTVGGTESAVSCSTTCSDTNYACTTIGTTRRCCLTTGSICSSVADLGASGGSSRTFPRWTYNSANGRCLPFTFLGQSSDGNPFPTYYNNFLDRDTCDGFCSRTLCEAGSPITDSSGLANLNCGSTPGVCPQSHSCTNSVCCPRKTTVCGLPRLPGNCAQVLTRYWYNAATGNCESFLYSGCQGNANNFDSLSACLSFCSSAGVIPRCPQGEAARATGADSFISCSASSLACPANYVCTFDGSAAGCCPTRSYTCSLASSLGVTCGGPSVRRWFYDTSVSECRSFAYAGCDGNSNNFATQADCRDYCAVGGCPDGGNPARRSDGALQTCTTSTNCQNGYVCTAVTSGGIATNRCCPTRASICRLPPSAGINCGVGTLTRYYFNPATRQCTSFTYQSCGGNRNNFASLDRCRNFCNSADCPAGQVAQQSAASVPAACTVGGGASLCSSGYTCTRSALFGGAGVCCGSSAPANTCPSGQSAYISPFTLTALQCTANVAGSCPANNICWYSVQRNNYFCCAPTGASCPEGGDPFINPSSNQAQQCSPGVAGSCAVAGADYVCQARTVNVGGIPSVTGTCCRPLIVTTVCGTGFEPFVLSDQSLLRCHPTTSPICPTDFSCRANPVATTQFYCCRQTAPAPSVCGANRTPLLVGGNPLICTSGTSSSNCPSPYACVLYAPSNAFYCCQTSNAGSCPTDYSVVIGSGGVAMACSPTANACGSNAYCQYQSATNSYVCCRRNSVSQPPNCPINFSPVIINGRPQICTPSASVCAATASCSFDNGNNQFICCNPNQVITTTVPPSTSGCSNNRPSSGPCTNGCPVNYQCEYSVTFRRYQCCQRTASPADEFGCPQGTAYLYPSTRLPLVCTPGFSPCPSGSSCLRSTVASRFQCCILFSQRI